MRLRQWTIRLLRKNKRKAQSGSATMELGLISPLLLLMLFGAVDFARVYYDGIAVANAARSGVQYGSLTKTNSSDTSGMIQAATYDGEDIGGITITAERFCACPNGTRVDCVTGKCGTSSLTPAIYVKVTAQKTFQTLMPYPGVPRTVTLQREAFMRAR